MPPARRPLDFRTVDEVIAEVQRLHRTGYRRLGNWGLGETCEHLGHYVRGSLDGFTAKVPWYIRPFGPLMLRSMLRKRSMPTGVNGPREYFPQTGRDEAAEVAAFCALLERLKAARDFKPSPLFGQMSREQWTDLHLIHAAHHLSFLIPNESPAGTA